MNEFSLADYCVSRHWLKYCLEYQDNFPNDLRTANTFLEKIYDFAKKYIENEGELESIEKCREAAIAIINNKKMAD